MTKGINSVDDKQKRKLRIRNHIARDLSKPKFRQQKQTPKPKKRDKYPYKIWSDGLDDD